MWFTWLKHIILANLKKYFDNFYNLTEEVNYKINEYGVIYGVWLNKLLTRLKSWTFEGKKEVFKLWFQHGIRVRHSPFTLLREKIS